jgi:hypothetical protein
VLSLAHGLFLFASNCYSFGEIYVDGSSLSSRPSLAHGLVYFSSIHIIVSVRHVLHIWYNAYGLKCSWFRHLKLTPSLNFDTYLVDAHMNDLLFGLSTHVSHLFTHVLHLKAHGLLSFVQFLVMME